MKNQVINNPYRILGVYVGDSPALEQKNLARFRAFEKVGQMYEISLQGEDDLPSVVRTEKDAREALQRLALPEDRIRYSLLWYSDGTSPWGRELNEAVRSIVKGDYGQAIIHYEKLIASEPLREGYVCAVTHGLGNFSIGELANMLSNYFIEDQGYKEFMYGAAKIPSQFLASKIYLEQARECVKESVELLENVSSSLEKAPDFYKTIEELKRVYAKIEREICVGNKISGVDSFLYQQYVIDLAKAAYKTSSDLVLKIGDFIWNQKYKVRDSGYKKYRSKMPRRAINECMRLIKETDQELQNFLSQLKPTNNSDMILYRDRQSYQTILSREYVTDEKVLRNANRHFMITRSIGIAIWLTIMLSIIISTLS